MTNRTYLTYSGTKNPSQPFLKSKIKSLKIKSHDLPFIGICVSAFTYFTINYPLFIATLGCASVVFLSLWHITQVVPLLEKWLHGKIRFWHLTSLILAVTAVLSLFDTPAQALFLSGLEEFFKQLAQGAQASGSGQTISNEVIELIFNLIRGAFLLLVAAASLFAYNQAQQGNDWRPIITQVGLSFAIVIAVDVVTFLFIGNQSA
jgi:hypothetical protein